MEQMTSLATVRLAIQGGAACLTIWFHCVDKFIHKCIDLVQLHFRYMALNKQMLCSHRLHRVHL